MKLFNTLSKIITIFITIINISCSKIERNILKYHSTEQGHLLNEYDMQHIHIGMNKFEISSQIGTPTIKDIFGSNTWYYIHYYWYNNKIVIQKTIILNFDKDNILINFEEK